MKPTINNLEGLREKLDKILLKYTATVNSVPTIKGIPIYEKMIVDLIVLIQDFRKQDCENMIKLVAEREVFEDEKNRKAIKDYYKEANNSII